MLLAACFFLFLFSAFGLAEEEAPVLQQPITVTANNMEAVKKENLVIFRGDVIAQQKDYTLYSDELHVFYTKSQEIREIIASGGVRIVQSDKVATAEKAVYSSKEQTIVLTGDPQIEQECDTVRGAKIIIFLNENKSVVEGGEEDRVKAVMFSRNEKAKVKCSK